MTLKVCECHFPGTGFLLEKYGKFPVPSIREHPLAGPVSVPPFGTCQFPSHPIPENETGIPEIWYWTGNFLLGTEICYINGCSTIFCLILQKPKNKKPFQDKLASLAAGAIFKPVFTLFDKNSIFWLNSNLDSNHSQGVWKLPHKFNLYLIKIN